MHVPEEKERIVTGCKCSTNYIKKETEVFIIITVAVHVTVDTFNKKSCQRAG